MKTYFLQCRSQKLNWVASIIVLIFLVSCEKDNLPQEEFTLDAAVQNKGKANTANGFQAFHQGFNHNTNSWADQYVEGVLGWCGTINLLDRKSGGVIPSKGSGYATVMWGECNDFWQADPSEIPLKQEEGLPAFAEGAPATQDPSHWSSVWPASGYVQNLDIYLNPEMFDEGVAFTYSQSLKMQDEMAFIYFAFDVVKESGELFINEFKISEEGWYTFSYVFGEKDGNLSVDFELLLDNQEIYSFPIESRLYAPEVATSSLEVDRYGSGYIWFVYIQEGVALPIDEQILRPGK